MLHDNDNNNNNEKLNNNNISNNNNNNNYLVILIPSDLFLDRSPKAVRIRSPTPDNPDMV